MKEIRQSENVVLFLDELHTLIGAGAAEGAIDASNMLKPALSRGEIQTIGATTLDEYRKYIEKDGALERRFQPVIVKAPSVPEAIEIIRGLRHKYEAHHRVKITEQAINAAVTLADRYITDRQLPDKAIDVIDEASSRTRLMALTPPAELKEIEKELERVIREKDMYLEAQEFEKAASLREKEKILRAREEEMKRDWEKNKGKGTQSVGEEDIEFIVSRWTGIPLSKLEEKESAKLARMEEALHGRIIGQDDAVKAVSRAIRRSRAGLKDAKRPVGSFIFLGPTGVGKTELARTLAEYLFGDENALIRVDMSEYMEKFSVSRLLGAPPGYVGYEEGGFLTEKVRRRPYSVVLFDEIEKAHPDVFNMMLQVLDDGRLTDSLGHVVDFKNTILIMTSNLGTSLIGKRITPGFMQEGDDATYEKMKDRVMDEMKRAFRPEFINRIDDIIVFHALSLAHIQQIIRLMIDKINKQLTAKGIELILTPAAEAALVDKGYDPQYGARQLRRTIQKHIEDPLAEAIVRGQVPESARIEVDIVGSEFVFREVDFVGNKEISTSDLQDKIDLKLGSVYNPVEVQRAREKMKEHYESEGYFEVQITPDIEKFADGDVKVVFTINEGRQMKIDKIVIRGNRGLTDNEIKNAMATQERQYWILRGTVQRQRLDEDVDRILQLYNDHGYTQARVESHDVTVDRDKARVIINIVVVEGSQHRVASVGFTGVTLLPEDEVRRQVKFKPGDVFSRSALRESVRAIEDLYANVGRASVDVNPKMDMQPENKIAISFEINEGPTVYVERINIAGNVRSQDKILRRELQLSEGEIFTLRKLQRSKQRLTNLGYFEKVDVTTAPGSDKSKIIVNVDVTERPTGLFSIGGGFSSADGLLGTIDLSQNNFLGRGWQAAIKIRAGANVQQGQISFTEPWLFDRPLSAGVDLFSVQRQYTEYDYRSIGSGVRLSHPFEEYWRWHLGYRLTQDRISNVRTEDTFLEEEK